MGFIFLSARVTPLFLTRTDAGARDVLAEKAMQN
jgi:hypothetical protein